VVHDREVAGLVPDHVVEDLLGREDQAPVEAHRARGRARAPARALLADGQLGVGLAERLDRLVEPRGDLGARRAPVPALDRGLRVDGRDVEHVATTVRTHATRLGRQRERRSQIRKVPGRHRQPRARRAHLGQPPLDPWPQLGDRERRLALARASRQRHVDAVVRVDGHPDPAGTRRAADRVGDLHGESSLGGAAATIIRPMPRSVVRLPTDIRSPFEVYVNGVRQQLGEDYEVHEGALVFERELRKDRISGWRWFLGAWGVGTYRQDDSVDVRYERADGSPAVAQRLDIELR
jgi:hypothetical protein